MAAQKETGDRTSPNSGKLATLPGNGPQRVPKDKDPCKPNSNLHHEHQDQHGSGEGLTGMQPGAGHPRGR